MAADSVIPPQFRESAASSSSSSLKSCRRWKYDVFISFRGEDTRRNFTDHLYYALRDAGVNVFRDDPGLSRGEDVSSQLKQTIRSARISLIVFSPHYANSRWCLQELAEIMECRKTLGQMAVPIFYNVDPSDVRRQRGTFGDAFAEHEKMFTTEERKVPLSKWRTCLTEAGSLSGWDSKNFADGHEARFIKRIVKEILDELKQTYFHVADHPVGLDSRLKDISRLLDVGSESVRFVGICGMGGIGKTTLSKAVYNKFFHLFEGKCFLANVRENSEQQNGLVRLQEQLLSNILKSIEIKLDNADRGSIFIKERLHSRRVLIVLDDIDHPDQLQALAGGPDWFGPGSRIIITTRNRKLPEDVGGFLYMARGLDFDESLSLFSLHAFQNHNPKEEFVELSDAVVAYSDGLPLALKVLGAFLRNRSPGEWESTLERLNRIPHKDINQVLKISYDGLLDIEKALFLDIACFFFDWSNWDKDYVIKILDCCGLFPDIGIPVLKERCLLEMHDRELRMHDLIRDMGREIVRAECNHVLGKQSRLWHDEDTITILRNHQGTKKVEGIVLQNPRSRPIEVNVKAFKKMKRLRLLHLKGIVDIDVRGDYGHIFPELKWLHWHKFNLECIPDEFTMENLVMIDMRYSTLRQLWGKNKFMWFLKVLNLSHSSFLSKTPDFSDLPNLEELILEGCIELKTVDQSIGNLQKLTLANFKGCRNLELEVSMTSICRLKSLKFLNISGCAKIEKLPEEFGKMTSLTDFLADGTGINEVPPSILCLKNLRVVLIRGHKASDSRSIKERENSDWVSPLRQVPARPLISAAQLTSLQQFILVNCNFPRSQHLLFPSLSGSKLLRLLSLVNCNLSDDAFETTMEIGSLPPLKNLDLSGNNFTYLPAAIRSLPELRVLTLNGCRMLRALPDMAPTLRRLEAANCESLETVTFVSDELNPARNIQRDISAFIHLSGCRNLSNNSKDLLFKDILRNKVARITFPGSYIPDCFSCQSDGPSLWMRIPPNQHFKLKDPITIFVVYEFRNGNYASHPKKLTVTAYAGGTRLDCFYITGKNIPVVYGDHQVWVKHLRRLDFSDSNIDGNDVELNVTVNDNRDLRVKRLAIRFGDHMNLDGYSSFLPFEYTTAATSTNTERFLLDIVW